MEKKLILNYCFDFLFLNFLLVCKAKNWGKLNNEFCTYKYLQRLSIEQLKEPLLNAKAMKDILPIGHKSAAN